MTEAEITEMRAELTQLRANNATTAVSNLRYMNDNYKAKTWIQKLEVERAVRRNRLSLVETSLTKTYEQISKLEGEVAKLRAVAAEYQLEHPLSHCPIMQTTMDTTSEPSKGLDMIAIGEGENVDGDDDTFAGL
jgi:ribosomal protein L29